MQPGVGVKVLAGEAQGVVDGGGGEGGLAEGGVVGLPDGGLLGVGDELGGAQVVGVYVGDTGRAIRLCGWGGA